MRLPLQAICKLTDSIRETCRDAWQYLWLSIRGQQWYHWVAVLTLCYSLYPQLTAAQDRSSLFGPSPQRQQLILKHFQHGVRRARAGERHQAIGHFQYCTGLDAEFLDAHFMLGLVYYHLGLAYLYETDYAMSRVLELQSTHPDALVYRGITRMRLGAFAAADLAFTTSQGSRHLTVAGGTGFGSMNDPVVFVGLGQATQVDRLDIQWPSGHQAQVLNLPAGQESVLTEGTTKLIRKTP